MYVSGLSILCQTCVFFFIEHTGLYIEAYSMKLNYIVSCIFLLVSLFLFVNISFGESQMDLQSMVELLNFSKLLVQDGEMTYLCYNYFPHSAEVKDKAMRDIIAFREEELRNNVEKRGDPNLRPIILKNLETEKKYEPFRYSDAHFKSQECTLVFRMQDDYKKDEVDYRLVIRDRFENHPSLGSIRYFCGGYEYIFLRSGEDTLSLYRGSQFQISRVASTIQKSRRSDIAIAVNSTATVVPSMYVDEASASMEYSEYAGEKCYIISHFPREDDFLKVKVYVRFSPLPEILREEYLNKNAETEEYWLRLSKDYSDFETIESISLAIPKRRDQKEFRLNGELRRRTVYTIKEMDFNIGLPDDYFNWKLKDLDYDDGSRKRVFETK